MADRPTPRISSRKQPKQARSTELVSAILEAAVQVLAAEGAQRFTSARVAEKAGVSVGSLYQYFPNKAAILFRLQSDEWRQTTNNRRRTIRRDITRTIWPKNKAERIRTQGHGRLGVFQTGNAADFGSNVHGRIIHPQCAQSCVAGISEPE